MEHCAVVVHKPAIGFGRWKSLPPPNTRSARLELPREPAAQKGRLPANTDYFRMFPKIMDFAEGFLLLLPPLLAGHDLAHNNYR